jgi:hypothetical protein
VQFRYVAYHYERIPGPGACLLWQYVRYLVGLLEHRAIMKNHLSDGVVAAFAFASGRAISSLPTAERRWWYRVWLGLASAAILVWMCTGCLLAKSNFALDIPGGGRLTMGTEGWSFIKGSNSVLPWRSAP